MSSFISKKSVQSFTKTVGDAPNPVTIDSMPFHDVNMHILDNDVNYGVGTGGMDAIAPANSVLYFEKGDLTHFMFKNRTAGVVARVAVVATVVHPDTMRELGRTQ